MHVNLLPPELIARSRLVRSMRNWCRLVALWGVTLLALCAPLGWKAVRLRQQSAKTQAEIGPLRFKENKTRQLNLITSDLKKRSEQIRKVLPPNRIPALLGIFGKTFHYEDSPIALHDFGVTIQGDAKPPDSNAKNSDTLGGIPLASFSTQIIVRGYASTNPSVAEVIEQLEDFGVFDQIHLKSAKEAFTEGQQVDEFELECVYAE